jgi:hypothetical protein
MYLRRILALALLVPFTGPGVFNLVAHAHSDVHACADGTCRCPHARPKVPAAPAPCHDGMAARPEADCKVSARCNHEAPAVAGTTPCTLASGTGSVAVDHTAAPAPLARVGDVLAGFSRIDSPPPRLA